MGEGRRQIMPILFVYPPTLRIAQSSSHGRDQYHHDLPNRSYSNGDPHHSLQAPRARRREIAEVPSTTVVISPSRAGDNVSVQFCIFLIVSTQPPDDWLYDSPESPSGERTSFPAAHRLKRWQVHSYCRSSKVETFSTL